MTTKTARVDKLGRARAGSQLQIQIYVNRRSEELSQKVFEGLPDLASLDPRLNWVSPLEKDRFAEYQDAAFLKRCGLEYLSVKLKAFWPYRGPVWDALASIEFEKDKSSKGILLAEAKSYPAEIYGVGCKASPKSREKIENALKKTKKWCGISADTDWTGPLYQSANRMAHLYFFRNIAGVPAWLANINFLNDPHSPTDCEAWQKQLKNVKAELGIPGSNISYMADIFLKARDRSELAGNMGCP